MLRFNEEAPIKNWMLLLAEKVEGFVGEVTQSVFYALAIITLLTITPFYLIIAPIVVVIRQKKKQHTCEYCKKGAYLAKDEKTNAGIKAEYPSRLVAFEYDEEGFARNWVSASINYCPMCGRKLKK